MTTENASIERAHAEQLMAAFAVVLTHPAGFGIELFVDLWIDRLEDGRFRVARYTDDGQKLTSEELFDDVRSATDYYLDLRDELRLGIDYESTKT
jgi:hypothetical protein